MFGCSEPGDEHSQPNPSALQQPPLWPSLWTISHRLAPRVEKSGSLDPKAAGSLWEGLKKALPGLGKPELGSPTGYAMVRDGRRVGLRKRPDLVWAEDLHLCISMFLSAQWA